MCSATECSRRAAPQNRQRAWRSACYSVEQLLPLLVAQTTDASVVVDSCLLHNGRGLRRAVAGQSLDDLGNLGLLGHVVSTVKQLGDAYLPSLHLGQELAALLACSLGLRQRLGALLR